MKRIYIVLALVIISVSGYAILNSQNSSTASQGVPYTNQKIDKSCCTKSKVEVKKGCCSKKETVTKQKKDTCCASKKG